MSELIFGMGDVCGHVGRNIDGFMGVNEGLSVGGRNQEGRMLLCIANAWFGKADKKKIAYGS